MALKSTLLKIYNYPLLTKEKTNENQKKIRDIEWEAVKAFIRAGKFLDVGCGAGYAMQRAQEDTASEAFGIDQIQWVMVLADKEVILK